MSPEGQHLTTHKEELVIKVLKPGKFGEHWKAELPCSGCEALLEVEAEDVKVSMPGEDYDGGAWVVCPICCKDISVLKALGLDVYRMNLIKSNMEKKGERS